MVPLFSVLRRRPLPLFLSCSVTSWPLLSWFPGSFYWDIAMFFSFLLWFHYLWRFLLWPVVAVFYGSVYRSLPHSILVPPSPPCHGWRAVPPLVSRCVTPSRPSLCSGWFMPMLRPVLLLLHCLFLFALCVSKSWCLVFSSVASFDSLISGPRVSSFLTCWFATGWFLTNVLVCCSDFSLCIAAIILFIFMFISALMSSVSICMLFPALNRMKSCLHP